jgi:hypothetical protein
LIARLEADAEFVDAGAFTLEIGKAREKLAEYQLADPQRFVLMLVEAAHLLPGCTGISFEISDEITRADFEGVGLGADELRAMFDSLFVDVTDLDPHAAQRVRGHQRLALASPMSNPSGRRAGSC